MDRFACQVRSGCNHFLRRKRRRVKEGLHRRLAEEPSPLVSPFLVVALDPGIEIVLRFGDRSINLLAEDDAIELIEQRLVEPLDDAVGLWALGLGGRMVAVTADTGGVTCNVSRSNGLAVLAMTCVETRV
jgi:hypothetical protein